MKKLVESFNNAFDGFFYVLKTQRNMRIHFLLAVFVIILGVYLNLTFNEILILCVIISLVLLTEMINTSIELTIDLIKDKYHPLARMAKDVAAGAVLISTLNAIIVGYLIFARHVPFHIEDTILRVKQSPWNITLVVFVVVIALTIMSKVLFHKGRPLKGGMPSGHSAVAFTIWTIIAFSAGNTLIISLTFVMAILVAKSRVSLGIHTLWEVLTGSVLGVFATTLIFQLFKL